MMSSKEEKKQKAPPASYNHGSALVPLVRPSGKRQKTNNTFASQWYYLLIIGPEVLRKIYSFLTLREALRLCQTHRQFNEAPSDIYQYSIIVSKQIMKEKGFVPTYIDSFLLKQTRKLCNLVDCESLRAVLRNKSLPSDLIRDFMAFLVEHSETDNGQAVSILLEDGRSEMDVCQLEEFLKKDFTAMAAALQQVDRVKKDIQMCHTAMGAVLQQDDRVKNDIQMCLTCSNNIGCYKCTNYYTCVRGIEPRYCRECVLKYDRFCRHCEDYLCPSCFVGGVYGSCEKCGGIACRYCQGEFLNQCHSCDRRKCDTCIQEERENWWKIYDNVDAEAFVHVCPTCVQDGRYRDTAGNCYSS